MQAVNDIFSIWPSVGALALAIDQKHDTVYRWRRRGRIPEGAWTAIIKAASSQGKVLTIADMHAANRAPKLRRKTHGMTPKKRTLDGDLVQS